MKMDKIDLFRDLLVTQTDHWMLFPIVMFIANTAGVLFLSFEDVCGFLLLGMVLLVMGIIIQKRVRYVVLLPVPFILYLYYLNQAHFSTKRLLQVYIVMAVVYLVIAIIRDVTDVLPVMNVMPPYIYVILMFLLWIAMKAENVPTEYFPYVVGLIVATILYMTGLFVDNYMSFTYSNIETSASMPKGKIFRAGFSTSGIYVVISSFILITIALLGVPNSLFDDGIFGLFKAILKFLFGDADGTPQKAPEDEEMLDRMVNPFPEGEESLFGMIIGKLILVLVWVALLAAAYAIVLGIIRVIRYFRLPEYRREGMKLILEDGSEEEYEKLGEDAMFKDSRERERNLSVNQRIRRLYKKQLVNTVADVERRQHMTAREYVQTEGPKEPETFADIYEKARYSNAECDKEDLKNMHIACRRK